MNIYQYQYLFICEVPIITTNLLLTKKLHRTCPGQLTVWGIVSSTYCVWGIVSRLSLLSALAFDWIGQHANAPAALYVSTSININTFKYLSIASIHINGWYGSNSIISIAKYINFILNYWYLRNITTLYFMIFDTIFAVKAIHDDTTRSYLQNEIHDDLLSSCSLHKYLYLVTQLFIHTRWSTHI